MSDSLFVRYWRAYGGAKALLTSGYFYTAWVLDAITYPAWIHGGWWGQVFSIMPNVLGFSLGGYAIWMAIGDERFRELMAGEATIGETSPFMAVNAAFVHFILMQIIALVYALVVSSHPFSPNGHLVNFLKTSGIPEEPTRLIVYGFGYWVFLYALMTAVAATFAILRVSSWYDRIQTKRLKEKNSSDKQPQDRAA